jgi:uncharacterized membrane protein
MTKYFKILIWPIAAAPLIVLATVWSSLPAKVATHFNLQGQPDRFGTKQEIVIMVSVLSLLSAGVYFLLANIYKIDPKKYAAENKERLQRMGFTVGVFIAAVACFIVYSMTKGNIEPGIRYIFGAVGILLSFLGNYMYNIKPNYFAGIRLPWTLNNEENWRKTHMLAGKLWFAGGLFMALLCFILPDKFAIALFFACIAILIFIPVIYSYRMYRRNNQAENGKPEMVNHP